jgi:hypothetical protein
MCWLDSIDGPRAAPQAPARPTSYKQCVKHTRTHKPAFTRTEKSSHMRSHIGAFVALPTWVDNFLPLKGPSNRPTHTKHKHNTCWNVQSQMCSFGVPRCVCFYDSPHARTFRTPSHELIQRGFERQHDPHSREHELQHITNTFGFKK